MQSYQMKNNIKNENQKNNLTVEYRDIERVEPPNWWVGFKNPDLQLLVKGDPNITESYSRNKLSGSVY